MLAVALAAVMFSPMGSGPAQAAQEAESYSLTVNTNEKYMKEDPHLKDVTIQIYKVADLNEENAADSWNLTAAFAEADKDGSLQKLLDEASMTNATTAEEADALKTKYRQIESRATYCIVDKKIKESATTKLGTKKDLAAKGIYIAVPVLDGGINSDGAGNISVETDKGIYTFSPILLFVPGVDPAEIADGEWAYGYGDCADVVINAKVSYSEKPSKTTPPPTKKTVNKTTKNTRTVKTGDEFPVLPILVAVVAAALLVLIRRRGTSENR